MSIKSISITDLNSEQQQFLQELLLEFSLQATDPGIPVYRKNGTEMEWVLDFKMPTKANRKFEKSAPDGLYRGGAVVKTVAREGVIGPNDERYDWMKPFAGIAHFCEGPDLTITGRRELAEEAFVALLNRTARIVPIGSPANLSLTNSLGVTVAKLVEVGEVKVLGHEINEKNRAFEAVLEWDFSGVEGNYTVTLEEDWWQSGRSGVTVIAVDQAGTVVGYFSGQQGFVDIRKISIHPTLQKYLA